MCWIINSRCSYSHGGGGGGHPDPWSRRGGGGGGGAWDQAQQDPCRGLDLEVTQIDIIRDCGGAFCFKDLGQVQFSQSGINKLKGSTYHRETGCRWRRPGAERRSRGWCMSTWGTWEHRDRQSETNPGSGQTHGQPPWRGRSLQPKKKQKKKKQGHSQFLSMHSKNQKVQNHN